MFRSLLSVAVLAGVPLAGAGSAGLAARYPGDAGIARHPAVLFAEDFESGDLWKWDVQRGGVALTEAQPHAGRWCVQMTMIRGQNHGGDTIKWFMPGADKVHARVYVKFSGDYQYPHHFLWLSANQARKVNCFWLQHYGYDPGDPTKRYWGEQQTVWFDDVVIAREYIGPRTPAVQTSP